MRVKIDAKKVGINLMNARLSRGYQQNEVAEALGFTSPALSQWEAGKRSPEIEMIMKLSAFYKVPMDFLMGNEYSQEIYAGVRFLSNGTVINQKVYDRLSEKFNQKYIAELWGVRTSEIQEAFPDDWSKQASAPKVQIKGDRNLSE